MLVGVKPSAQESCMQGVCGAALGARPPPELVRGEVFEACDPRQVPM